MNIITAPRDYYGSFRSAGLGRSSAALQSANMTVGKVVGYSTLLEGAMGVGVRDQRILSTKERVIRGVGGGIQTATFAVAAANTLHGAASVPAKPLHGNNLNTTKPARGYTLRDKNAGEVLKYGETTLGKGRYTRKFLEKSNARMKFEAAGAKRQMHYWNHEQILKYKATHGARPPLNKSNW